MAVLKPTKTTSWFIVLPHDISSVITPLLYILNISESASKPTTTGPLSIAAYKFAGLMKLTYDRPFALTKPKLSYAKHTEPVTLVMPLVY